MTRIEKYLFASVAAGALGIAVALPAQAQVTAAAAAVADEGVAVPEVVVTAQKRAESLQDVPISMTVVTGKTLNEFHSVDFKSIMDYLPNVSVATASGNEVIYIRGFGSAPTNYGFDQSVSLYVDGVYAGRSRQALAPYFDQERLEVLRGPQGALFGKNTPAGAISIVSAGPKARFEAGVTGVYNFDFDGYDLSGYVSGPVSDTLGVRLAAKFIDQDGYVKNLANGRDEPSQRDALARLTIRYAPSDTFDITAKVDYGDREVKGLANVSSPLNAKQTPVDTRFSSPNKLGNEGAETTSLMESATANLRIGEFTLTSITAYSWFRGSRVVNFDQTVPGGAVTSSGLNFALPERFHQFSQEVRLLSPTGRKLEYIVGAYYDDSRYEMSAEYAYNLFGGAVLGTKRSDFDQDASTFSVFGQATYHFNDQARVIGSLRYTDTSKNADYATFLISGNPPAPFTSAKGEIDEDNVDPSITLQYDFTPQIMAYATYGKGSKSGGFVSNTFGTTDATFTFDAEESENYEAGVKSTLFEGRLVLNLSVYNTEFKDLQVSTYNPALAGFNTGNAASATSKGIEGSFSWYPVRNFDISGSAALQDAEYDDFPGAGCLASQPITECNPASPASIAANNIAGAPLPYTSDFSGSLQVHHRAEFPNEMKLDSTLLVSGRTKFFNADNQSPVYGEQKGYAKVDLRLQLSPQDEQWRVAVVGKNLTNEHTTGSAFNLPFPLTTASRVILFTDPPRSFAIEAGYRF